MGNRMSVRVLEDSRRQCVSARLIGIIVLIAGLAPAFAQTHQWQIECVDCPRFFTDMTNRSIAVDGRGQPHIVYGGDHLSGGGARVSAGTHFGVVRAGDTAASAQPALAG
ncbi:MAG: hypothetical protein MUE60_07965 [Candidatus Eisenbacteria bacterium]|jgi:hypothetical protein|nr:hypothetical protein [Candidatus Eisenbacteria bacterium]